MDFPNSDKLWHLAEYGVLAALIARLLRTWNGWSLSVSRVVLAILIASLVGAVDERFQAGVPGRESSVLDWAADSAGAALGAITYASIARGRAGELSWL
jgi:VanZ family protein